jgi:thymidylate kinase
VAGTTARRAPSGGGPRGLVIAVDGPSGAGKSTVTARTAREFGWAPLAEAFDRLTPAPSLDVDADRTLIATERALLGEDGRRWRAARDLADRGTTVVADTGFLGTLTYTAGLGALGLAAPRVLPKLLDEAARRATRSAWGLPDLEVYLACPPSVREARAGRDPVRHPPKLRARHHAVGRLEEGFYRTVLPAVLGRRAIVIRSDGTVDEVVRRVGRAVRSARAGRVPDGSAREALRALAEWAGTLAPRPPPRPRTGRRTSSVGNR